MQKPHANNVDSTATLSQPRKYARYFPKTSRGPAELVISDTHTIGEFDTIICVSGKAEARRIAAQRNAIAWNF